uniref:Uncharacterized protein n=1 Tax=Arundo donax TaxID=35708 RepID=A0A0A9F6R5_ARUDO
MAQNKILHPINEIYEGLQEAGFVDFLNCIWSKAKDPKKNMATDYFYFNDRTDVTLAKRLGEMTEPESEIRC